MMRDDAEVVAGEHQREQRADAGRRQRRQDRDRMDVALVEHAEHDVHRDDRGEDQQQLVGERRAERQRRALEARSARWPAGRARCCAVSIASTASPSEAPGARLNEIVAAGNWPRWLIDERRRARSTTLRDRATAAPAACGWPGARSTARRCSSSAAEPALELGLDLEDHAVLVRLREDRRDQALAERVVERVVDRRRRDAEPARRVAVDLDVGLQAVVLQVAGDVGELRHAAAGARPACGTQMRELVRDRRPRRVNWYCVRLTRSSIVRSCTGCM